MGTHNMLFHILLFTIMSTAASNNNRNSIPVVGLGVFQSGPGQETYTAVLTALQNGYRHIDSAALYKGGRRRAGCQGQWCATRGDIHYDEALGDGRRKRSATCL